MPVRFYLYPMPNKKGECPIRVSISIGSTRFMTGIGYNCAVEAWEEGKGVKAKYTNSKGVSSKMINARITSIQAHFMDYELKLIGQPDQAELKKEFKQAIGQEEEETPPQPVKVKNIFDHLKEFVQEQRVACQWAHATVQCWTTFTHHLEAFSKKVKYEDFNEDGVNRFVHFLRVKRNLEEKTVQKQFNNLKWFLNWAIRKGYCKEEYINKYRPKFKVLEKPVIFLTKEELLYLYNYKVPANGTKVKLKDSEGNEYEKTVNEAGALEKTKDLFCFCCFTSLRYSDMAKVRRTDIVDDTLYVTTQKTNDRLPINLNSFAKEILAKYKDTKFPGGLALPVITNQKMNYYLKDLCELCEFNEPISITCYRAGEKVEETFPKYELIGTHAGRRTFICFALSQGIAPQVVMKWTGHSDYKAMKPYIDIAEKTKAEAMNVFEMGLKK
jgi:site-specific recombinase XerD